MVLLLGCGVGIHQLGDADAGKPDDSAPPDGADSAADPADSDDPDSEELAILSLNLHCFKLDGTGFADHDARFAAIAEAVAAEGVRALAVQEACTSSAEGVAIERLAEALTLATGRDWGSAWAFAHVAWEGTEDEADEGVGILAEGEPAEVTTLAYAVQGGLERVLLAADVGGLRLSSVHLDYDDEGARRAQARQSAMELLVRAPEDQASLLAGDFNATAADVALTDLEAAGLSRLSAAADDGDGIDHVLAPAAAGFVLVEAREMFTGEAEAVVSDHPGVLVRLVRGEAAPLSDTRLVARADAGFGHHLALRGDQAPLDWELGWPGVPTADDRWEARFWGWSGEVAYKWLHDDLSWERGEDHVVAAGEEAEVSPDF